MLSNSFSEDVVLGGEGRILLSARVRRALELTPGESVHLRVEDGRVIIEKREHIARRLKQKVKAAAGAKSLSRALIKERKRDAKRE